MTHDKDTAFNIKTCRGKGLCPFGLVEVNPVKTSIESALNDAGWDTHLKRLHPKGIRPHDRLRVAVAACPNGCSQPQICDIGLIASLRPTHVLPDCSACGRCAEVCREDAVRIEGDRARIRPEACLACGECVRACPLEAIRCAPLTFRLMIGGHMGRHPAWAEEVTADLAPDKVPSVIRELAGLLLREHKADERIWQTFVRIGKEAVLQTVTKA